MFLTKLKHITHKEVTFVCEKKGQYRNLKIWALKAELQQRAQGWESVAPAQKEVFFLKSGRETVCIIKLNFFLKK